MWASVTYSGQTLTQLLFKASFPYRQHAGTSSIKYWLELNGYWPAPAMPAQHLTDIGLVSACNAACSKQYQTSCFSQQTQNICITFVQRRPNVFDVGPTLYKCYKNVLCLLGLNAAQRTQGIEPVLVWCWASVADGGPELGQCHVCSDLGHTNITQQGFLACVCYTNITQQGLLSCLGHTNITQQGFLSDLGHTNITQQGFLSCLGHTNITQERFLTRLYSYSCSCICERVFNINPWSAEIFLQKSMDTKGFHSIRNHHKSLS